MVRSLHGICILSCLPEKVTFTFYREEPAEGPKSSLEMAQLGRAAEGADVFLFRSPCVVCPVASLTSFPLLVLNLYLHSFFPSASLVVFPLPSLAVGLGNNVAGTETF